MVRHGQKNLMFAIELSTTRRLSLPSSAEAPALPSERFQQFRKDPLTQRMRRFSQRP